MAVELEILVDHERRAAGHHPPEAALDRAVRATLDEAAVTDGHLALSLVSPEEMRELNLRHRGRDRPTDVLSFPVDEAGSAAGPRELGDVVICLEHTDDVPRAAVHGVLHLLGHDHETDGGEMLALEDRLVAGLRR